MTAFEAPFDGAPFDYTPFELPQGLRQGRQGIRLKAQGILAFFAKGRELQNVKFSKHVKPTCQ